MLYLKLHYACQMLALHFAFSPCRMVIHLAGAVGALDLVSGSDGLAGRCDDSARVGRRLHQIARAPWLENDRRPVSTSEHILAALGRGGFLGPG